MQKILSPRSLKSITDVHIIHQRAVKLGRLIDIRVSTHLINLYSKSGCLESACNMLAEMPERNTVAWTVLISGFSAVGFFSRALDIFADMLKSGSSPNCVTLAGVFKCLAGIRVLNRGKTLHGWIIRNGIELDTVLRNSMLDFYAKCGDLGYAVKLFDLMPERDHVSSNIMIEAHLKAGDVEGSVEVFEKSLVRDVISWNTIINGLVRSNCYEIALKFLYQMVKEGLKFSRFTISISLSLVGALSLSYLGREIHGKILRSGDDSDGFVRCSLIDMYAKCGCMGYAYNVFDMMRSPYDTISWSSVMAGYVHNEMHEEAILFFRSMLDEHVIIDLYTLTTMMAVCSDLGILTVGRQIHCFAMKLGFGSDVYLSSAIIDMYGKCGSMDDARSMFNTNKNDNIVSWTSLIASYAYHGHGRKAVQAFEMMLDKGMNPNEVTFLNILCACSHAGLVREGYRYFKMMREKFSLVPNAEHLTCMVDLLGKAGFIEEALNFICGNDISENSAPWKSLLSSCRDQGNADVASVASDKLIDINGFDHSHLSLLLNIYSAEGNKEDASRISKMMEKNGVRSQRGLSWIQLEKSVHMFTATDQFHPKIVEINYFLNNLMLFMKGMNL